MDRATFEAQLPEHLPALRALARRLLGHTDDAGDVVQDALVKASASVGTFRGDSSLKTWLFAITTRVALDHLRASKPWRNQVLIDACDERGRSSVEAKYGDPSVHFDVGQHIAFCFTCVGRSLEPRAHAALLLKEVFGLENAEAARVLELTEPAFRHALAAARAAMSAEFDGLCALVNKQGPCYQCRALRELAPEGRKGPALPATPLPFDERLSLLRRAHADTGADQRLTEHFFSYVRQQQSGP